MEKFKRSLSFKAAILLPTLIAFSPSIYSEVTVDMHDRAFPSLHKDKLYSVDASTGQMTLLVTVPDTIDSVPTHASVYGLNSLASNTDKGLFYFTSHKSDITSTALFAYDMRAGEFKVLEADMGARGVEFVYTRDSVVINTRGMGSAGASFDPDAGENGRLYFGIEDENVPNESYIMGHIYSIEINSEGLLAGNAVKELQHDMNWGDFIVRGNKVYSAHKSVFVDLGRDGGNDSTDYYKVFDLGVLQTEGDESVIFQTQRTYGQLGIDLDNSYYVYQGGINKNKFGIIDLSNGFVDDSALKLMTLDGTEEPYRNSTDASGNVPYDSSVEGRAWSDANKNGVQDSGDLGFAGITVELYIDIDGDGQIDTDVPLNRYNVVDRLIATDTTDALGNYRFNGLIPNHYIIKIADTNTLLTGGDYTTSDASTQTALITKSKEVIGDINFGYKLASDFGDIPLSGLAPDGINNNAYGEAEHTIVDGFYLGAVPPDKDQSTQANIDTGGDGSDEEGIHFPFPVLTLGVESTMTATVTGVGGYLQGWIDFDGNGVFDDDEQIAKNLQDGDGDQLIEMTVAVPVDAITNPTYSRFRWSTTQDLTASSISIDDDGEVEDYSLTINIPPTTDNITDGGMLSNAGSSFISDPTAGDADGLVVYYVIQSLPAAEGGILTLADDSLVNIGDELMLDQANGLKFAPTGTFNGDVNFTLVAKDNQGAVDPTPATITIPLTNSAPITDDKISASMSSSAGVTDIIDPTGMDNDGSIVAYIINSLPIGGTLYLADGITAIFTGQELTPEQAAGLRFDPDGTVNGNISFTIAAKDNQDAVDLTPATITIPLTNHSPATDNKTDSGMSSSASATDIVDPTGLDNDGSIVAYIISSLPIGGTLYLANGVTAVLNGQELTVEQANGLKFDPDGTLNGDVSFTLAAKDNQGAVDTTSATITIPLANSAPITDDKTDAGMSSSAGTTDIINPSGVDNDGSIVAYIVHSLPTGGILYLEDEVTIVQNGQELTVSEANGLEFDPDGTVNGDVSFTLAAKDNQGAIDLTPATITIPLNNSSPATDDKTDAGMSSSAGATDIVDPTGVDSDGSIVAYIINSLPTGGILYLADGITAVLNGQELTFEQANGLKFDPDGTLNGDVSFTLAAKDNQGAVDATPATITIPITNSSPVTNDLIDTGMPNSANATDIINPTGVDSDGSIVTYIISSLPTGGTLYLADGVTAVLNGQELTLEQANGLKFDPDGTLNGNVSFTLAAKDNQGAVDATPATMTIPLNNSSPATDDKTDAGMSSSAGATDIVNPTAVDSDGSIVAYIVSSLPTGGTLYLADGITAVLNGQELTLEQANGLKFDPDGTLNGDVSFTLAAKDNQGAVDATPATITIPLSNSAPITDDKTDTGMPNSADATDIINPIGVDNDGSIVAYIVSSLPTGGTLYLEDGITTVLNGQELTLEQANGLKFDPDGTVNGDVSFALAAKDNQDAVDPTPATMTIPLGNRAPINDDDTFHNNIIGTQSIIDITANDRDHDGDVDKTTVSLNSNDATDLDNDGDNDNLIVPNEGSWTVNTLNINGVDIDYLVFTPLPSYSGDPTPISYTVNDNNGDPSNIGTVTVTYGKAPVADHDGVANPTIGTPAMIDVLANDTDIDGNVVSATIKIQGTVNAGDEWVVLGQGIWSIDTNQAIVFTPELGFEESPTSIHYTVSDDHGNISNLAKVTVAYGLASVATDDNQHNPVMGSATTVDIAANDTDSDGNVELSTVRFVGTTNAGDPLTIADEGRWTINNVTGVITFTPALGLIGNPSPIQYTVDDNDGNHSNQATVRVTYGTAPLASPDGMANPVVGEITTVNLPNNDSDADGTLVLSSVRLVNPAAGSTLSADEKTLTVPGEGKWVVDDISGQVAFAPSAGLIGNPTPIEYTIDDNDGNTSSPAVITVTYGLLPEATDDVKHNPVLGEPTRIDVLANDNDLDPDSSLDPATVQFVGTDNPNDSFIVTGEGEWSIDSSDGEVTFTPEANFTGDPRFIEYGVRDNDGNLSNIAKVTVTYGKAPVVVSDTQANRRLDSPTVIDVLNNDHDSDGTFDLNTVRIVSNPTGSILTADGKTLTVPNEGIWSVDSATGTITFTPEADFVGNTTPIFYTVDDQDSNTSNPATVTVNYSGDSPAAGDDHQQNLVIGTATEINVLGNDTDSDGRLVPETVKLIDTDGTRVNTLVVAGEGIWQVNADTGMITFTPEFGFSGDPTPVQYTVEDEDGNRAAASTVTVTYGQAPVVSAESAINRKLNSPTVIDVISSASDVDGSVEPSTVQIISQPAGSTLSADGKTLTVPNEGIWSVDSATGTITFTPEADFVGNTTPIEYTVKDQDGNTSNPATITVMYSGDSPAAGDDSQQNPVMGTATEINVLGNDTDSDGRLVPETVKLLDTDGTRVNTLVVAGEGIWQVNADTGMITFTPELGFSGDPTPVQYTVEDEDGNRAAPSTVTVSYGQAPVVSAESAINRKLNSPTVIDVVSSAFDVDGSVEPSTVQIISQPAGSTLSADGKTLTVPNEGIWSVDPATGKITFTPEVGFIGNPTPIEYTVKDQDGNTSNPATITVMYSGDSPAAGDDSQQNPVMGTATEINVLGNDTDSDGRLVPETVKLLDTDGTRVNTLVVAGEGIWQVNADTGMITFTPELGFSGDPTPVQYTVEDEDGNRAAPSTVTVSYGQAPVVSAESAINRKLNSPTVIDVVSSAFDVDGSVEPSTVQIISQPAGSTLSADGKTLTVPNEGIWSVDPATGKITFTPEVGFIGNPTPIEYTVKDQDGNTSNPATITVMYSGDSPAAGDDSQQNPVMGTATEINVLGNDTDSDGRLVPETVKLLDTDGTRVNTLVVAGEGIWQVNADTGMITFTPELGFSGDPTPVQYTVEDEDGNRAAPSTVTVSYGQAPVVSAESAINRKLNSPTVIDVVSSAFDVDGSVEPSTVQIISQPAGSSLSADGKTLTVPTEGVWSVDPVTGTITFTPDADFIGNPTPIEYTVEDQDGNTSNPATITVMYSGENPNAGDDSEQNPVMGTATEINVLGNDTDSDGRLVPETVKLLDTDGTRVNTLVVAGEGIWQVNADTGMITFTPELGFSGDPTPVQYTVEDEDGNRAAPSTVTVSYGQAPVVSAESAINRKLNSPTVIDVVSSAFDVDGSVEPSTVQIISQPAGSSLSADGKTLTVPTEGVWSVDPVTGTITFTPDADFIGNPTPIEYTVEDQDGNTSNPATITVMYSGENPNAGDDSQQNPVIGTATEINVLGNDTDSDGRLVPETVKLLDTDGTRVNTLVVAGEGIWQVNADTGMITFTPELGFSGDPTPVQYTVEDEDGNRAAPSTVTVSYGQAPVVSAESAINRKLNSPTVIDVVSSAFDVDGSVEPSTVQIISQPAGSTLSADGKTLTVPNEGIWSVDPATGKITFTPEVGFIGNPTPIEYTVKDQDGNTSNPATITVMYSGDSPAAGDDSQQNPVMGTATEINVLGNDTDSDGRLVPETVKLIDTDGTRVNTLVVAGEGVWQVNADTGMITFTPELGFSGDPTPVQYTVEDEDGNRAAPSTVTVSYGQAPVVSAESAINRKLNSPTVIDVISSAFDVDGSVEPSTVQIISQPAGSSLSADGKTLTVPTEGVWSVDPVTGTITFTPDADFIGNPTPIEYTVEDQDGNTSNPATITVMYSGENPNAGDDSEQNPVMGTATEINVLGNDTDSDGRLVPETVKLLDTDGTRVNTLVVAGEGIWQVNADTGMITFTPELGFSGDPTPVQYTVEDEDGNRAAPSTVTVSYGQAPVVSAESAINRKLNSPTVIDVVSSAFDVDGSVEPSTVQIISQPAGSSLSADGKTLTVPTEGVWSVDPVTGTITFTPDADFIGNPTPIEYTVEDQDGNTSNPATITVMYSGENPNAGDDSQQNPVIGTATEINVLGNDTDSDGRLVPETVKLMDTDGTAVQTLVVVGEGIWQVNPETGSITFTPDIDFSANPTPIQYTVEDEDGNRAAPSTVTVTYSPSGVVTGTIYEDSNGNGQQDSGEQGIPNVTIKITNAVGTIHIVKTDTEGHYTAIVPAGETIVEIVEESLPTGFTQTDGGDSIAIDVPEGGIGTGTSGYQPSENSGVIKGFVYEDRNGNGTRDTDEVGIAHVSVIISDSTGGLQMLTTDSDGRYHATVPAGEILTDINETTLPGNSRQTEGTDVTSVMVSVGQVSNDTDGYEFPIDQGTIRGLIYQDTNGNGVQDEGELGIAGVQIEITDITGNTQTVITDAKGRYIAIVPVGFVSINVQTKTLPGGSTQIEGSGVVGFIVPAGESIEVPLGFKLPENQGSINGLIYADTDGNGSQDKGEPGMYGISVTIVDSRAGIQKVITDSAGRYNVNLPAGLAVVDIDQSSIDASFSLSEGTDPSRVTVPIAGEAIDVNGFSPDLEPKNAGLNGVVFFDLIQNGGQDTDEQRVGGWLIEFINNETGVIVKVKTEANGHFNQELEPGDYQVRIMSSDNRLIQEQHITLNSGQKLFIPQPVVPSGIVYDENTGKPISGAQVFLTDANGVALPDVCIGLSEQGQLTGSDGAYMFFLNPGADAAACPITSTLYLLKIIPPENYELSTNNPPETQALDSGNCEVDVIKETFNCDVSNQRALSIDLINDTTDLKRNRSRASKVTRPKNISPYYTKLILGSGFPCVNHNNIPLVGSEKESSLLPLAEIPMPAVPMPARPIPTLSEWAYMMLMTLMGLVGVRKLESEKEEAEDHNKTDV